jgi:hypothetical protein
MTQLAFPFKDRAGMELRDYVASEVLKVIISSYRGESVDSAVLTAFEYADAFIELRQETYKSEYEGDIDE